MTIIKRRILIFIGAGSIIPGCSDDAGLLINGNIRADVIEQILSNESFIYFRREINNRLIRGSYLLPVVIISARVAGINYPIGPRINQTEYLGSEVIEDKFEPTALRAFIDFLNGNIDFVTGRTPRFRSPRYITGVDLGSAPLATASNAEDRRPLWYLQVRINFNFDSQQNSDDRVLTEVTGTIGLQQAAPGTDHFIFNFPNFFWDLRHPRSGNNFVLSFLANLSAIIVGDQ